MGAMAVTRTKVEEFRFLAQECRATALTLSTEQARAEMLPMADVCDRVAAHPTHGNDGPEAGAVSDFHDEIKLSGLIDRGIDWNHSRRQLLANVTIKESAAAVATSRAAAG
jgi:hypothetical protein